MVTPAVKREAVAHLRTEHEMSERRACRLIGCQRMTVRYRSRRPDDPTLRERLYGCGRLHENAGGSATCGFLSSSVGKVLS